MKKILKWRYGCDKWSLRLWKNNLFEKHCSVILTGASQLVIFISEIERKSTDMHAFKKNGYSNTVKIIL